MKKIFFAVAALAAFCLCSCASAPERKEPRKVAVQTYSTHDYKFDVALKRLSGLGVKYVECYPGQRLSDEMPKAAFGHNMTEEQKAFAKKLLADCGIQMVSYGCVNASNEADIEKICAFVKEMGGKTVVTEAKDPEMPIWNKVCGKYGMKMALHSHERRPKDPTYMHYDPKFLMTLIKNYDNVGICADNGAWSRSGLDVLDGFRCVRGKLIEVHLKDQIKFNDLKSRCAIYGQGVLDMKAILAELDAQGFDGYLVIENGDDQPIIFSIIEANLKYLREN